jgi:hypothetical protein
MREMRASEWRNQEHIYQRNCGQDWLANKQANLAIWNRVLATIDGGGDADVLNATVFRQKLLFYATL